MLYIRGHFDNCNSYGILASELAMAMIELGVDVRIIPMPGSGFRDADNKLMESPLDRYELPWSYKAEKELVIQPPVVTRSFWKNGTIGKRYVHLTMFETPRIYHEWVEFENTCEAVVLPNELNVLGFHCCGVNVPMYKIPLGYDEKVFHYRGMRTDGLCVFGIGGRIHPNTDIRKGVKDAVGLFNEAFPDEEDVRLEVKSFQYDAAVVQSMDKRIKFIRAMFTKQQMSDWYSGLTAYLSMSRSEGWGLMQMEAMVTGRPIISTRYMGIKEFCTRQAMYEVDWDCEPGKVYGLNFPTGVWTRPVLESIIEQMRAVYDDDYLARAKGVLAYNQVKHLTWKNSASALLKILRKLDYV